MGAAQSDSQGDGSSRSLPDQANLENLRKQAKSLHRLLKSGDEASATRVREHLPRLSDAAQGDILDAGVTLQEVQHVVAAEYGFGKWPELVAAVSRDHGLPENNPARTWRRSLQSYEYEAEIICSRVKAGEYWSLQRVRKHIPRLSGMSDDQVAAQGVNLEEARQIVAAGANYDSFEELAADAARLQPVSTFEDLAELDDGEIREVIWRVGRDALAIAIKSVSEHFKERLHACMDEREWRALIEQMEELGPMPLSEVEIVQLQILRKYCSDDRLV